MPHLTTMAHCPVRASLLASALALLFPVSDAQAVTFAAAPSRGEPTRRDGDRQVLSQMKLELALGPPRTGAPPAVAPADREPPLRLKSEWVLAPVGASADDSYASSGSGGGANPGSTRRPRAGVMKVAANAESEPFPAAPNADPGGEAPAQPGREDPAVRPAPGVGRREIEPQPAPGNGEESAPKSNWGLAPVRWGGNATDEFRWTTVSDQPGRFEHIQIGNVRAATYIWQPWFAQVLGSLGFVSGNQRSLGDNANTISADSGGRSTTITGSGTLSLFPVSRFPFSASFDVSDSRASGQLTTNDFVSKRISLRQNYQPEKSNTRMFASFDRSLLTSHAFGTDTVDAWNGTYSTSIGVHNAEFVGSRTTNKRSTGDQGSLFNRVSARHTYRPDPEFSSESMLSYSDSDLRQQASGITNANRTEFIQANNFFTWRPDEELPFYLTGGARFFSTDSTNNGVLTRASSLSANVAGSYTVNRNMTLAGGVTAAQTRSGPENSLVSVQTATLNYSGDPIKFGNFSYDWYGDTSVNNQIGGKDGGNINVSGQFGHTVSRQYALNPGSSIGLTVGQTLAISEDHVGGQNRTLGNNAGVSWRVSGEDGMAAFVSLTGSDTRTTGTNQSRFQFVNLQANGQWRTGRYSLVNGNFTLQVSKQSNGAAAGLGAVNPSVSVAPGWTMHAYGTINYQNTRLFGTPGLRYTLAYTVNTLQLNTRLMGNADAQRDQVGQSLEQRIDYRVGRLDVRFTLQIATLDGKENALALLQVGREFGDF